MRPCLRLLAAACCPACLAWPNRAGHCLWRHSTQPQTPPLTHPAALSVAHAPHRLSQTSPASCLSCKPGPPRGRERAGRWVCPCIETPRGAQQQGERCAVHRCMCCTLEDQSVPPPCCRAPALDWSCSSWKAPPAAFCWRLNQTCRASRPPACRPQQAQQVQLAQQQRQQSRVSGPAHLTWCSSQMACGTGSTGRLPARKAQNPPPMGCPARTSQTSGSRRHSSERACGGIAQMGWRSCCCWRSRLPWQSAWGCSETTSGCEPFGCAACWAHLGAQGNSIQVWKCGAAAAHRTGGCPTGNTAAAHPFPLRTSTLNNRCTLRWKLSHWNYKLAGRWAWFPAGTFAANMLGTTIDFALQVGLFCRASAADVTFLCFWPAGEGVARIDAQRWRPSAVACNRQGATLQTPTPRCPPCVCLQCVLQRRGPALGYWGNLMINSVITGFNGSLTTVSTFITEVRSSGAGTAHPATHRRATIAAGCAVLTHE